jgi:hypothetical protein
MNKPTKENAMEFEIYTTDHGQCSINVTHYIAGEPATFDEPATDMEIEFTAIDDEGIDVSDEIDPVYVESEYKAACLFNFEPEYS